MNYHLSSDIGKHFQVCQLDVGGNMGNRPLTPLGVGGHRLGVTIPGSPPRTLICTSHHQQSPQHHCQVPRKKHTEVAEKCTLLPRRTHSLEPVSTTLYGKRWYHHLRKRDQSKDFEKRRIFWIITVDPEDSHVCPYKREAKDVWGQPHVERTCENRGRWSDAATAQAHLEPPGAGRGRKDPARSLGREGGPAASWCRTSALQTVRQ